MSKLKLAINGAAGRMGQTLARVASEFDELELVAGFEHGDSPALGQTLAEGVEIVDATTMADADFDLLVDFTTPESTLAALEQCRKQGRAMVIGTTGCDANQQRRIADAGQDVGIVFAPNFSVGVNLSLKLIEMAAATLGDVADIEVIGAHHRHKADSPSGTALAMGEAAARAMDRKLEDHAVYAREGRHGPRKDAEIGFSTIQAGDIVGEHTVMFACEGERLEITHKASDRAIFARGALRAAQWLADRPAGLYGMKDVLSLN